MFVLRLLFVFFLLVNHFLFVNVFAESDKDDKESEFS